MAEEINMANAYVLHEKTAMCVITRHDRTRLGNVDNNKSLAENLTTVIDLYERALMTPSQIDVANPSEMSDAEWVIERVLEVLHDRVVSCKTCRHEFDYGNLSCDKCLDFSEWERSRVVNTR